MEADSAALMLGKLSSVISEWSLHSWQSSVTTLRCMWVSVTEVYRHREHSVRFKSKKRELTIEFVWILGLAWSSAFISDLREPRHVPKKGSGLVEVWWLQVFRQQNLGCLTVQAHNLTLRVTVCSLTSVACDIGRRAVLTSSMRTMMSLFIVWIQSLSSIQGLIIVLSPERDIVHVGHNHTIHFN